MSEFILGRASFKGSNSSDNTARVGDQQPQQAYDRTAVLNSILVSVPYGGAQYHFGISQIGGRNYLGLERECVFCRAATA